MRLFNMTFTLTLIFEVTCSGQKKPSANDINIRFEDKSFAHQPFVEAQPKLWVNDSQIAMKSIKSVPADLSEENTVGRRDELSSRRGDQIISADTRIQAPKTLPHLSQVSSSSKVGLLMPDRSALIRRLQERRQKTRRRRKQRTCCPAVSRVTTPTSATRIDGSYTRLYQQDGVQQTFIEHFCDSQRASGVRQKRKRLRSNFKCRQEFSFSYAVFEVDGKAMLDQMKVASGCTCVLTRKRKKQKQKTP